MFGGQSRMVGLVPAAARLLSSIPAPAAGKLAGKVAVVTASTEGIG